MNITLQRNHTLQPDIPYHFLHEQEPDDTGKLQEVNTIFLTSKQCPYKCVMCDLWKNTRTENTPPGAIIKQIDDALSKLPAARIIKLYNNGNFFDKKAIPPSDYPGIIERVKSYERVIVENQPRLCGKACWEFNDKLNGRFEIAMGLETIHPDVFPKLNKPFTLEDYKRTCSLLKSNDIDIRAFILLNPPFLTDKKENIEWTLRTVEFAFENGAHCCSIIAARPGTEFMQQLQEEGRYVLPTLDALEEVFEKALDLKYGRVFVDTWDIGFLSHCPKCFNERIQRLEKMNLEQRILKRVVCDCRGINQDF